MKSLVKPLLSLAVAAAAVLVNHGAQAQELKVGYVNIDRVLRDAAPAKAAQSKLEQEFNRREKELNEAAQKLKSASDKFEKDAPTLAESERSRRQRDLVEQDREIKRKSREFQEDLSQRKNEELAGVLDRANKVVKQRLCLPAPVWTSLIGSSRPWPHPPSE